MNMLPALPARDDTFFGVCEAIGEDFGFHANWLRLALALATFWSPVGAIAAYAGMGLLVFASRLIAPNPPLPAPEPAFAAPAAPEPVEAEPQPQLPLAA